MGDTIAIAVHWEGPLDYEALQRVPVDEESYGLYQIYGLHPVYRDGDKPVLLYLGKTTHQYLQRRIEQHWEHWLHGEKQVEIRLGRLDENCYERDTRDGLWADWCRKVDLAERLTIWQHCPSYNSQYVARFPLAGSTEVVVENLGERGALLARYASSDLRGKWRPEEVELL